MACSEVDTSESQLTIAVASNMQITMGEIATRFEQQSGIRLELSSGSSGVLSAQIKQGAPFDVFLSANMKYPTSLQSEGLTADTPKIYAYGRLILWSLDGIDVSGGLQSPRAAGVSHFAIANPVTAPYGIAAMQALKKYDYCLNLETKW
jgi:molybdate transport system substrate-binding protein